MIDDICSTTSRPMASSFRGCELVALRSVPDAGTQRRVARGRGGSGAQVDAGNSAAQLLVG